MLRILTSTLAAVVLFLFAQGAQAQGVPADVETIPAAPDARQHLPEGADHDYGTPFPTSGPHSPHGTAAGFYTEVLPSIQLVHALEHGNIVIYYDQPGEAVTTRLRDWTRTYSGHWDGIVVTPSPGIGEQIVLTAWEKRLFLARYDEEEAAAFIDAFRGRGPEHPVR